MLVYVLFTEDKRNCSFLPSQSGICTCVHIGLSVFWEIFRSVLIDTEYSPLTRTPYFPRQCLIVSLA
jgi:hypothetical protein